MKFIFFCITVISLNTNTFNINSIVVIGSDLTLDFTCLNQRLNMT